MNIVERMETYRDALTDSGVRCVLDARDVNPPCVLIRPPTMSYRFGRGCVAANFTAYLYLPDAGQFDALRTGIPILETIHDTLATVGVAILQSDPADYQLADGGTVPGFTLTWNSSH